MEWWTIVGLLIVFIFYSFVVIVLVLENRNPSKTLAWLLVLTFIPIVGFFFYLIFGQNFRKKRKFRRKGIEDFGELELMFNQRFDEQYVEEMLAREDNHSRRRLIQLVAHNSQSPFTMNNRVNVLTNGVETFRAIIQALSEATHHIHMQYYIWRADDIGRDIQRILIEKARAGVEVRVMFDGFGSRYLDKQYIRELREAGVEVCPFLPVVLPFVTSRINYRNHRKIVVVDGKVAFMGGLNIGDEYLGKDPRFGFWRDTHLQVRGDAVYVLQAIFFMDWAFAKGESHFRLQIPAYFPAHNEREKHFVQIAASGPDSDWEAIMQAYFTAIASATRYVHITTPYFIPDDSILMVIKTAALSGIDVKLLIPSRPDHKIVFWATKSYLEELLEAGVKVYAYEKGFIHSKVLIVDGVVASIGTANMDMRSFFYNFEVNALIYDEPTVQRLEEDFINDLKNSHQITLEEVYGRSFKQRLTESSARILSPLL